MYEEKSAASTLRLSRLRPSIPTQKQPRFRSRADAELTAKLYSKAPVLIEERPDHPEGDKNPWGISFQTMFNVE